MKRDFSGNSKSVEKFLLDDEAISNVRIVLEQSAVEKEIVVPLDGQLRLKALDDLDVLDEPSPRSFQMLVDLANKFLGTPVSLISLVTDDRQFFLSASGLGEPWASCRETPLSHSFCQHVVNRNEPLVVADAESHSLLKENLAINDLGVKAYLGVPIVMPDGNVIGSFCAIDGQPRDWTQDDLETIEKLVELTVAELTERKASKARQQILENRLGQAQKMQAIGQLVGGVAHDFNNILGAIQIQADLLELQLGKGRLEPVGHIRSTILSAKGIVQQLLNWSRPSSDAKAVVSLNEVVTESLPLISTYATKFIEIHFEPVECADLVMADANKISQILLNLCSNSAYAMRTTGGKVTIEVSAEDVGDDKALLLETSTGPQVKLRVSDTGCGIPGDLCSRIHDPYFTTKPVGEGTGLGLWTVFGIVREHGGSIHVDSVVNQGTTIEIYFPLCVASQELVVGNEIDKLSERKDGLRLLVIDDEPVIAEGLERMFNLCGYSARSFTNGCEALKVFANDPDSFDIVITDQVMPHISGEELIRELKAVRPGIPVILCSGYSESFQRKDSESRAADAYCEKPMQFEELAEKIEKLCVN